MKSSDLLKHHDLRTTECRLAIVELFQSTPFALSHADIEEQLTCEFDRVTIYRTLKTFQEKGLIHKVLDDATAPKYALCTNCQSAAHNHAHVHFKCLVCGQTNCLYNTPIPLLNTPQGYLLIDSFFLMSGICERCNKTTTKE